jgi:hypothetical protein
VREILEKLQSAATQKTLSNTNSKLKEVSEKANNQKKTDQNFL